MIVNLFVVRYCIINNNKDLMIAANNTEKQTKSDLINFKTSERMKDTGIKIPENPLLRIALASYLRIPKINKLYRTHLTELKGTDFINKLLDSLNISVEIDSNDLKNIPNEGPFIVISNHPFGFLDGLIMLKVFANYNPDYKVLANYFLNEFQPISSMFIPLNPFQTSDKMNTKGLKAAIGHLKEGKPIGIFPAGEVSTYQSGLRKIKDKEWDEAIVRFIKKMNVPVLPVYFYGKNSRWFHLLGKVHPALRTLTIPSELFKKHNHQVKLRIGKLLTGNEINEFYLASDFGTYLRARLEGLGTAGVEKKSKFYLKSGKVEPVIQPVDLNLIEKDILLLQINGGLLFRKSDYEVYLAESRQIPSILVEIGRLRELTYREVGEGTNKKIDLDKYDTYYRHLFVFSSKERKIIGAYRLGAGDEIMVNKWIDGFYISSLFEINGDLSYILSQTLELGRSFVVKEYQQKPMPLFLLWQGILHFLKENRQFRYLLGPLSMSNRFSGMSKDLLVSFILRHHYDQELSKYIKPKRPYRIQSDIKQLDVVLNNMGNDMVKLDRFISSIEISGLKVPVLLKQYVKQRAKILAFNVDPQFNNSLDGLMILDLKNVPEETYDFLNGR